MKILLQNKNIVLANNSLISIDNDNIAENGNLVKIKQSSEKNDILKISNSLVRVKVAPDPPVVDTTETWVIKDFAPTTRSSTALATINISFTTNNLKATSFGIAYSNSTSIITYGNIGQVASYKTGNDDAYVWTNNAYRTIILDEPATGTLLTWLQKNAVKQEK